MNDLVESINKCLSNKNWYGALVMSLIIPDICGYTTNPEERSKNRYIKWFDQYLKKDYESTSVFTNEKSVFLTGEDCYALRCSFLHEGSDVIIDQNARKILDRFIFTTTGSHCCHLTVNGNSILQLDVASFCTDICNAATKWVRDISGNSGMCEVLNSMLKVYENGFQGNGFYIS